MASSLNAINLPALWHTRGRRTNPWGAAFSQAALGRTLPTGRGEKAALRHALRAFPLLNTCVFRLVKIWWWNQKTIVECSWAKWGKARGQLEELSISFPPRSAGSSKTIHNSYSRGVWGDFNPLTEYNGLYVVISTMGRTADPILEFGGFNARNRSRY